jgi:hypothetical protein
VEDESIARWPCGQGVVEGGLRLRIALDVAVAQSHSKLVDSRVTRSHIHAIRLDRATDLPSAGAVQSESPISSVLVGACLRRLSTSSRASDSTGARLISSTFWDSFVWTLRSGLRPSDSVRLIVAAPLCGGTPHLGWLDGRPGLPVLDRTSPMLTDTHRY